MNPRRLAVFFLFTALAVPAIAQVTIDDFSVNQTSLSAPPDSSSTATGAATAIIGTKRGIVQHSLTGAGPSTAAVAGGFLTLTVPNTAPDSRAEARLSWDNDSSPLVLNATGLGGMNLTAGNASGLVVRVASAGAGAELEFTVYTSATNYSRLARLLPAVASSTDFLLPFTEFRTAGGTGASFSSVGAIELTVRGKEITVVLDQIGTSLPAIAATKTISAVPIVDVDGDGRVDPGDKVRYTVTFTNTGNNAVNVDINDNVDPNTTLDASSVSSNPVARNDQYGWFGNVTLSATGSPTPTLLANDADPDGDTVVVQSVASPTAQGGTVTLVSSTTGSFTYVPPAGFKGVDSFSYTINDGESHTSTATAYVDLQGVVWFVDNACTVGCGAGTQASPFTTLPPAETASGANDIIYVRTGNASYDTGLVNGFTLDADEQFIGEGVALDLDGVAVIAAGAAPTLVNADGRGLTLTSGVSTVRGLSLGATLSAKIFGSAFGTLATDAIDLSGTGQALDLTNGVLAATFTSIASSGSTAAGLSLSQVSGTLTSPSTTIGASTGAGITIATSTAALGFGSTSITKASAGTGLSVTGSAGTTSLSPLTVSTTNGTGVFATGSTLSVGGTSNSVVATGGPALDLTTVTLTGGATFATATSTGSPGKGMNLDTVTGALTMNGGSIGTPAGIAFDLNAGSSGVTYAGSISNVANALLVEITNRTGGTTTLSGNLSSTSLGNGLAAASNTSGTISFSGATKTLSTGADSAVSLTGNAGSTINFINGGLAIVTSSGSGFSATGGATAITVQGSNNSITSTTGTALNVANSTIGASGLNFQSISSNGAASGIVLTTTGSAGGLTVSGTGSSGSGGTVQNSSGPGISLSSTSAVSLASMKIQSGGDDGIRGTSVTGLNLNDVQVASNGNAAGETGIDLSGLLGSSTWSAVTVTGSAENNVAIRNTSGTLTGLTVTGSTFSSNSSIGGDGFLIDASGTASMTASIMSSTFSANRDDHFQAAAANSAAINVIFSGNTLTGGHATALGQGITLNAATGIPGYSGSVIYDIDNNSINGAILNAITVNLGTSANTATMQGKIRNNQIGTVGIVRSGSAQGSGIDIEAHGNGTHTTSVTNNVIRQTFDRGISVLANDGNGTINMTVTGNNASHSDGTNSREGFFINNGSADPNIFGVPDGHFACLALGGAGALKNTLTHGPGAPDDFRLRQRFNSTIRLPGYGGTATDTAAVIAFVNGNNTSTVGSATVNSPPGGGFTGGATCPTPP
ncbi:MAG: cadherin-like domain-containing protein [Thermoanaerobaculia bacterium]